MHTPNRPGAGEAEDLARKLVRSHRALEVTLRAWKKRSRNENPFKAYKQRSVKIKFERGVLQSHFLQCAEQN